MTLTAPPQVAAVDPRRWWALGAVATAQLMLAVDGTIMNIALPSAQRDLGLSVSAVHWVITSYTLAFAGLLLLGGRVSDLLGRRRGLLLGLAGFAGASVLGGLAPDAATLLTARTLLGVFGALMTPSAMALLSTTFPTPAERGRAFGIFGTVMGTGTGIGVLLGGVLTETLSWRAALWVNLPIAALSAAGVLYAVRPVPRTPGVRIDVLDALLATTGLLGVTYGLSRAPDTGWLTLPTLARLLGGMGLVAAFLARQRRADAPLLPPRILLDRRRASAYAALFTWGLAILASFLFLSFFLQRVLGCSPVRAGLAFLPYAAAILLGVPLVTRVMGRVPLQVLAVPGLLSIALALSLLGRLSVDGSFPGQVLPVFLLLGVGTALTLPVANSTATLGAGPDTAVAGATAMTSQQIGFSLGTAVLGTLAASVTAVGSGGVLERTVHGYAVAGRVGAGLVVGGAVLVLVLGFRGSHRPDIS